VKGDKGRQPGGATLCLLLGSVDLDRFVFTKSERESPSAGSAAIFENETSDECDEMNHNNSSAPRRAILLERNHFPTRSSCCCAWLSADQQQQADLISSSSRDSCVTCSSTNLR
jgi:hypothetical protein